MTEPTILNAILSINSKAEVVVDGDNIDTCTFTWMNGTSEISRADIKTKLESLTTSYNGLSYARARQSSYPTFQEFAEAYCEKEIGGDSTKWDAYKTAYNKVRSDNPKG